MDDTKSKDAKKLWAAYHDDPSVENNNRLVEHYMYLVKQIVFRMSPLHNSTVRDYDDLLSTGILGLMDAIRLFVQERNIKFETYAQQRIRGMILDYMRKQDWISVSMRKEIKQTRKVYDELTVELQRKPESFEVAERLNTSVEKVEKTFFNEYQSSLMHFENVVSGVTYKAKFSQAEPFALPDDKVDNMPEKNFLEQETKAELAAVIRTLSKNEQIVLDLYYVKEFKLKEIAEVMDLTESRISQIHRGAINKIAKRFEQSYEE